MALVALLATTIPSLIGLFLSRSDDGPQERWEPIATLSALAGSGVVYNQDWGVFVVDEPQAPLAFYALSPHNPAGDERVLFCPSSGYFEANQHGEKFDRRGAYVAGPAPRGLDRFDVRVRRDVVEVNVRVVYQGFPRGRSRPDPPRGPFCDEGHVEAEPGFWSPRPSFGTA